VRERALSGLTPPEPPFPLLATGALA
jgi:hypothetical protein